MELEKKYNIQDNFIGVFDNFFTNELIQKYIEYYNYGEKNNLVFFRKEKNLRKDTAITTMGLERAVKYDNHELINNIYSQIYPLYVEKFPLLNTTDKHTVYEVKIQKTKPSEGYHVWHTELMGKKDQSRLFAFMLYLNDVTEGGETEFLYQKCRVTPVKNRFILWPAGITHMHRGNPPLSNDKFVLTGWLEYL